MIQSVERGLVVFPTAYFAVTAAPGVSCPDGHPLLLLLLLCLRLRSFLSSPETTVTKLPSSLDLPTRSHTSFCAHTTLPARQYQASETGAFIHWSTPGTNQTSDDSSTPPPLQPSTTRQLDVCSCTESETTSIIPHGRSRPPLLSVEPNLSIDDLMLLHGATYQN